MRTAGRLSRLALGVGVVLAVSFAMSVAQSGVGAAATATVLQTPALAHALAGSLAPAIGPGRPAGGAAAKKGKGQHRGKTCPVALKKGKGNERRKGLHVGSPLCPLDPRPVVLKTSQGQPATGRVNDGAPYDPGPLVFFGPGGDDPQGPPIPVGPFIAAPHTPVPVAAPPTPEQSAVAQMRPFDLAAHAAALGDLSLAWNTNVLSTATASRTGTAARTASQRTGAGSCF